MVSTIEILILIGMIILAVVYHQKDKQAKYNENVRKMREVERHFAHTGNLNILCSCGDEEYIRQFGREAYDKIKSNTDTEIYRPRWQQ
jgi:hypothetical protein